MRVLYHQTNLWMKLGETNEGFEYLQAVNQYHMRVEELKKTFGKEYWRYIDPIPPTPPRPVINQLK